MSSCSEQFDAFIDNISLGERQVERIESAVTALAEHLRDALSLEDKGDVFLQGSYANGTAVRPPEDGEYDVDVVVVSATRSDTPNTALENLEDALKAHGRYKDRIRKKTPCVRLQYADDDIGGFHVDVVPVRPSYEDNAPLDAPRRDEGWHATAPREFTHWCQEMGADYKRTVMMLKYWRSRQQDRAAIKSILLQVLISAHMPQGIEDDAERLTLTLEALAQWLGGLDGVPEVTNPVLPSEDLAKRWSETDMADFVRRVEEAAAEARKALEEDNEAASVELWQVLLGDDVFPSPEAQTLGIRVADTSHAVRPASRGWYEAYNPAYSIDVTATTQLGKLGRRRPYHDNGPLLFPGKKLRFLATVRGPGRGDVWWRVTNTGGHARAQKGLRGEFFKAKKLGGGSNHDQRENWEHTSYTGSHLIEAFLVVGRAVVARSNPMRINIFNSGWRRWQP